MSEAVRSDAVLTVGHDSYELYRDVTPTNLKSSFTFDRIKVEYGKGTLTILHFISQVGR
jgi:hypothetical protein